MIGGPYAPKTNRATKPSSASASASARSQQHVLADDTVGLGLACDGLHTVTEDDADTNAGADGGQAVSDTSQ